jgi:hypothetical protein
MTTTAAIRWPFTDGTGWPGLLFAVVVSGAAWPAIKVQAFVFLSPVFGTLCAGWLLGVDIGLALFCT